MVLGGQPPGRVGRSHVIFFIYKKRFKLKIINIYIILFHEEHDCLSNKNK